MTPPESPSPVKKPVSIDEAITESSTIYSFSERALELSTAFEGKSKWGNVVGNFDDAVLTCGALGFTYRHGEHHTMIGKLIAEKGQNFIINLMPKYGRTYIRACTQSMKDGQPLVAAWTKLFKPMEVAADVEAELRALWSCPEMIVIQKERAANKIGVHAWDWMKKTLSHFGRTESSNFHFFAFYFDIWVQNGGLKGLTLEQIKKQIDKSGISKTLSDLVYWCQTEDGANKVDTVKNAVLLKSSVNDLQYEEKFLLILGWMRAKLSRDEYDTDVMNRRLIFAVGSGFQHGKFWDLKKNLGMGQDPEQQPIVVPSLNQAKDRFIKRMIEVCRGDLKEREDKGSNRSSLIDSINKFMKVSLGSPYCIGALQYRWEQVEKELQMYASQFMTAHCKTFFRNTPDRYIHKTPAIGDWVIWGNKFSEAGHAELVIEVLSDGSIRTIGYNTSADSGLVREGQGVYLKHRKAAGYGVMDLLGFVRVADMLLEKPS